MRDATAGKSRGVAVVTGASSGIGAATVRVLATAGFETVLGEGRLSLLESLASELVPPGTALPLDVTDSHSVEEFAARVPECRLLVNNAGGALGLEPVAEADEEKWRMMYETNVLGTLRMTKALLPRLVESGDGLVVNVGSVAGIEPYPGGAGYNGVKAALSSLNDVLRMELLGQPVRVSEIDPGMVETDFSLVRFGGDSARAAKVYAGLIPLSADDVAECIGFIATRPSHVDIDRLVLRPRDQARAHLLNRRS